MPFLLCEKKHTVPRGDETERYILIRLWSDPLGSLAEQMIVRGRYDIITS